MSDSPIAAAIKQICDEKGIPLATVIETIEAALAAAYRKDFGKPNQNIKVTFHEETGQSEVFDSKIVIADALKEEWAKAVEEAKKRQEEGLPPPPQEPAAIPTGAEEGEEKLRYHPKLHLTVTEAQEVKAGAKEGEEIVTPLDVPAAYGRMAAQTAKQVIVQKLREAERNIIFEEFKGRQGDVIPGTIQRRLGMNFLVDLGRVAAIFPPEAQIERERYIPAARFKFYIVSVAMGPKGPEIVVSRTHVELVRKLFTIEIPEIANGSVEVKGVSREAGSRSKIAVLSLVPNVDPIGACVGQRGSRVQTVIGELGGEKIDIIEWAESPEVFIANSLSPAKTSSITCDTEQKVATVMVKEDQLSLAIGKGGQNVRLASQLTGWRIDIRGEKGEVVPIEEVTPTAPEAATLSSSPVITTVEPVAEIPTTPNQES
ncbi:MAG: transcription termination factor NusA [bacterium]|nr:transcription termination factor NusA [bacterium]